VRKKIQSLKNIRKKKQNLGNVNTKRHIVEGYLNTGVTDKLTQAKKVNFKPSNSKRLIIVVRPVINPCKLK